MPAKKKAYFSKIVTTATQNIGTCFLSYFFRYDLFCVAKKGGIENESNKITFAFKKQTSKNKTIKIHTDIYARQKKPAKFL